MEQLSWEENVIVFHEAKKLEMMLSNSYGVATNALIASNQATFSILAS